MGGSSSKIPRRQNPPMDDNQINRFLRDVLRDYNDRDTEAINRHIKDIRDALEQRVEDVLRPLFGGSVSKHTFVDGLSDVDVLMVVNDSSLSGQLPEKVIQHMADLIRQRRPKTRVTTGKLAVTVTYSDGVEIQILPAIKTKSGTRIPDPKGSGWSNVLHPEKFAQKLTNVNQANNGRVIPVIKLTKGLADRRIQSGKDKISGYHLESMAIEAFKNYRGPRDLKSMLNHLIHFSADAVKQPIKDSTGQSRWVDEYLGPPESPQRKRASAAFGRMAQSLNSCRSTGDLDNLFAL